ncbi:MAG: hypothetical protein RL398_211 [Planctomycetota bacterium]|jgi:chromosomal replication initiator protein
MVDAFLPDPAPQAGNDAALQAELHQLLKHLDGRVQRPQFETWFRSLKLVRIDDREVELSVTSQFVRDWLQRSYLGVLQEAVATLGGTPNGSARRVVLSQRDEDDWDSLRVLEPKGSREGLLSVGSMAESIVRARTEAAVPMARPVPATPAGLPSFRRRAPNTLNPNYTFDKFVVGSCNQFAHASALATAENPGCAFNPLFVHGSVGLGKTHLLQAICHTLLKRDPSAKVLYLSCEDFTNAYIQAIQNHEIDQFREYYRSADMLVIDDVQFLANKDKTQDEFFHTFNALYDAQKQIVLSSDRPATEIPTIEERLVSRFKWGMVAEVQAPALETRAAIVRRKAKGRGIELPEDVALFLAERVSSNIRELEGAVIKVVGVAAITNQPINIGLAENCMRGMVVRHAQVSVDDIMSLITSEFAISARDLTGKGRTQTVSLPRQVAMFLLREHTESSLDDVGRIFGNRDHTTVLYAVNKIRDRVQKDRMFKELIDGLSNRLLTRSFRN